jgi:CheY-like chemotaxis protein
MASPQKSGTHQVSSHVLIAEDDPAVRSAVQRVLELEGYRVSMVNDGAAALAFITKTPPATHRLLQFCAVGSQCKRQETLSQFRNRSPKFLRIAVRG